MELLFYPNGSLFCIKHYEKGLLHGDYLECYEASEEAQSLSKRAQYEHGKLDGEQKRFFKEGTLQAIMQYTKGVLHGKKALWNDSGSLLEEATYFEGGLEGPYYLKRQNGTEIISNYKNNKLEGLYLLYFPPHPQIGKSQSN